MIRITDVVYTILIDRLNPDDLFATITNSLDNPSGILNNDVGRFLNWNSLELSNTINSPNQASSKITLITSTKYNADHYRGLTDSSLDDFMKTLVGRPISVQVSYTATSGLGYSDASIQLGTIKEAKTKTVYVGYISQPPQSVTITGGAKFTLTCKPRIGQLDKISSNSSWDDSTSTYKNTFSTVSSNILDKSQINTLIYQNTILSGMPLTISDGSSAPLPDEIWSFMIPYKNRFTIITELITPYSRLFFQKEDGTLTIQPLFYDDLAAEEFFVDVQTNSNKNYLIANGVNNSLELSNRVDCYFGYVPPVAMFGAPGGLPVQIYCTAPFIDNDNKISSATLANGVKYADVYKTSARLYNSGKYCMPQMRNVDLDNELIKNSVLLNALSSIYGSNSLSNSVVRKSAAVEFNTIPQLYSQLFLAEINANAYSATILYDYLKVINVENPLGKIVTISGLSSLDYEQNIVTDTVLSVDADLGSVFLIQTSPLFSITAAWYSAI
jgi:hypothetical protein